MEKFKYLGLVRNESGGFEEAVRARVTAAWNKWREASGGNDSGKDQGPASQVGRRGHLGQGGARQQAFTGTLAEEPCDGQGRPSSKS